MRNGRPKMEGERPLPDYRGLRRGKRRLTARNRGEDEHQEAESVLPVSSGTMSRVNACSTVLDSSASWFCNSCL